MKLQRTPRHAWFGLAALLLPILAACGGAPSASTSPSSSGTTPSTSPSSSGTTASPSTSTSTSSSASASASAATSASDSTSGGGDKVLRIHQTTYPDVFDPQKSSYTNEISILLMNYEGLMRVDSKGQAIPGAAEVFQFNEAGDAITFTLRSGLKYSDGSPLTSANFRYAVERNCDPATAGEYQSILFELVGCAEFAETPVTDTAAYEAAREGLCISTPDEQTIAFQLTNPAPYATYLFGLWVTYPVKQELVEAGGENWWQTAENHVGNGPFQITNIEEDQRITFEANENYWGGRPKLDGIEYVYQGDSAIALEAYRTGDLDIVSPDAGQLPLLEGDAQLSQEIVRYPGAQTTQIQFNLAKEPFNDPKVRQAFAYAFDRETYARDILNNSVIPTLTWIPPGIPGSIETTKFAFDAEKAKQAMAESSYGSGASIPEITFSYNSDDPATGPRIEYIAGQLRDVLGVNIRLDPLEGKALTALKKDNETYPQMSLGGWIQDYPDPQNWLSVYWLSSATFAQRVLYKNEEFDTLVRQADVEKDPETRIQLYQQAHEILIDDQEGVNLFHPAQIFLVKPEVTGYEPNPSDVEWPGQFSSALTIDINR